MVCFLAASGDDDGPADRGGALLAVYLGGNAHLTGRLLEHGRGKYREAFRTILDHTPMRSAEKPIIIGTDHPLSVGMAVLYHWTREGRQPKLVCVNPPDWPAEGVDWLTLAANEAGPVFQGHTGTYDRVGIYPTGPLSGFRWALYVNQRLARNKAEP